MVRREIAPTSQALQVAFSRLFREPMLSESTSFGSRWGIYEMSSSRSVLRTSPVQSSRKFERFLCAVGHMVPWSTYTPLKQEYAAVVAWPRPRRVKAQDSYLPSY